MLRLLLLSLFVGLSQSQVAIELQTLLPGEPEVCKDGSKTYSVGESWKPEGDCTQKSCAKDSEPGVMAVHYAGCGKIVAGPKNCDITSPDFTKSFPECCPKVVCN